MWLHTTKGTAGLDILLPPGMTLAEMSRPAPLGSDGSFLLLPSFGRLSRARSRWIPLGEGGLLGTGMGPAYADVQFEFGGLDAGGYIERDGQGGVLAQAPILAAVGNAGGAPLLGHRVDLDATALVGTVHEPLLQRPELLSGYLVELRDPFQPSSLLRHEVVGGSFDPASGLLTVDLDPAGPPLEAFLSSGPPLVELQPAYFRVVTDGSKDALPDSADVQIRFEATAATPSGAPEAPPTVPWTSDPADLNFAGNAGLRFVRFEVLFDVDRQLSGLSPSSPLPGLDYLRIPFRYP